MNDNPFASDTISFRDLRGLIRHSTTTLADAIAGALAATKQRSTGMDQFVLEH